MLSQDLCKARIRSYLVTGMTLKTSLPIRTQTCSIILMSGYWDGHWIVDMARCSKHATVRRAVCVGTLSCWNMKGCFLSPNMFSTESRRFFWQCSDIIVHIHVFVENDQITNAMVANYPNTITETVRFLLTLRRHSDKYPHPPPPPTPHPPPPRPPPHHHHHHLCSPHPHPPVTICEVERWFIGKLSETRCLVLSSKGSGHRRRSRFSGLMSVFYSNTAVDDHGAFSGKFAWKLDVQGV